MSRQRLRYPVPSRARRTRCGPRCPCPMPRRSSFTGSRCPGNRARSGRGRAGRPSAASPATSPRMVPDAVESALLPRRRGRRAGMTKPPGSGTAGSRSSTSTPITGRIPASSAAAAKRTTPYRPFRSVTARPVRPSSTARSTSWSASDAPSRNEKFEWQCSSANGAGGGIGPAIGPIRIEHLFD